MSSPDGARETRPMPSSPGAGTDTRRARLRAEAAQLTRFQQTRDAALRDAIIEDHLPLARRIASRYAGSSESIDDLFQVACVGLVKAVDRFDPARGSAFSSYAVPTMVGELQRHFRDHGWALRVPRELQELALDVLRARRELSITLSREPSVQEVAHSLQVSSRAVLDALGAISARHADSLDQPGPGKEDADAEPIVARVGCDEPGYERAEQRVFLEALHGRLSREEWQILRLRLVEDLTQRQIAKRVGVSQMTVSRTLRQIRAELVALADKLDGGDVAHGPQLTGARRRAARTRCEPLSAGRQIPRRH